MHKGRRHFTLCPAQQAINISGQLGMQELKFGGMLQIVFLLNITCCDLLVFSPIPLNCSLTRHRNIDPHKHEQDNSKL